MSENDEIKQIFEQLHQEHPIEEMATFSDMDISEKLQKNEMMIIKYKEMYYKELQKYEDLEDKMNTLKGIRYKWYKFEDDREWQKKEIEDYCMPSDPAIIRMKRIMAKQQARVRFFDMCWRSFDKLGWSMKVFTDREKMNL
jgi:hypothetical protein